MPPYFIEPVDQTCSHVVKKTFNTRITDSTAGLRACSTKPTKITALSSQYVTKSTKSTKNIESALILPTLLRLRTLIFLIIWFVRDMNNS